MKNYSGKILNFAVFGLFMLIYLKNGIIFNLPVTVIFTLISERWLLINKINRFSTWRYKSTPIQYLSNKLTGNRDHTQFRQDSPTGVYIWGNDSTGYQVSSYFPIWFALLDSAPRTSAFLGKHSLCPNQLRFPASSPNFHHPLPPGRHFPVSIL